jgi:hypothetical protein
VLPRRTVHLGEPIALEWKYPNFVQSALSLDDRLRYIIKETLIK